MLGDLEWGAFDEVPDELRVTMSRHSARASREHAAIAIPPNAPRGRSRDDEHTQRKRAALLAQVGRYEFDPKGFEVIEGEPIVYWWTKELLARYARRRSSGKLAPLGKGWPTGDNARFLAKPVGGPSSGSRDLRMLAASTTTRATNWVPYIKGAKASWIEPCHECSMGERAGSQSSAKRTTERVLKRISKTRILLSRCGVAFAMIGVDFRARRTLSAVFSATWARRCSPIDVAQTCVLMNRIERDSNHLSL